jgi:GTP cyclohydrolase III
MNTLAAVQVVADLAVGLLALRTATQARKTAETALEMIRHFGKRLSRVEKRHGPAAKAR